MNAGKLLGLALVIILTVLVGLLHALFVWLELFPSIEGFTRVAIVGAIRAVLLAIVLLPMGWMLDRSLASLKRSLEQIANDQPGPGYSGPSFLRPILSVFTQSIDAFRRREQKLQNTVRDLEIRHRVAEASKRHVEAALNVLRDGVLVTNGFDEILMVNQKVADLYGFDAEQARHKSLAAVINDQRVIELVKSTRDAANFSDHKHIEHTVTQNDGPDSFSMVFDLTMTCVEDHQQQVGGVVTIFHDLTQEREIARRETDFVSKASHELRTPLSAIRAYVEMLVDGEAQDQESRNEFYHIIQSEADRLGRLIDNMLNISRIEAGIVQIDREEVDIKKLVQRSISTLEPKAREKNITLHQKLAPVNLCVEGDADMMYQVVLNLVSNAVKYTPEGGRITVSADTENLTKSVMVSVADTGLGIPPDAQQKLFDKFYRVENYKRVANGTGLGLSLCKHIVETVHHGQIGVESELGMGSRFWFTIPMSYAGSRAAA